MDEAAELRQDLAVLQEEALAAVMREEARERQRLLQIGRGLDLRRIRPEGRGPRGETLQRLHGRDMDGG